MYSLGEAAQAHRDPESRKTYWKATAASVNLLVTHRYDRIANRATRDADMTMLQKPNVLILGSTGQWDSGESFIINWLAVSSPTRNAFCNRSEK
jgi:hypothetical protein